MLHTSVVQSEPNTFTPEVFPALHPHPVYPASGSGGKKTQTPSPGGAQQITWLSAGTAAAAAGRLWPGCWTARLGPAAAACGSWPEEYCTRSCRSYTDDKIEYDALSVPEGDRNSSLTQLKRSYNSDGDTMILKKIH